MDEMLVAWLFSKAGKLQILGFRTPATCLFADFDNITSITWNYESWSCLPVK